MQIENEWQIHINATATYPHLKNSLKDAKKKEEEDKGKAKRVKICLCDFLYKMPKHGLSILSEQSGACHLTC